MNPDVSKQHLKIGLALGTIEGALEGRTPTFRDIQSMAQTAEQIGFDSLWLEDHLIFRFPDTNEFAPWEAFTMLGALAAVTTRILLGPLVACTSFRYPALLAKMADALDEISGGRFILGIGAGWHQPEYEAFGYPFDHRVSRFEEALQIILPLLKEGYVDFQGNYYQVRNCVLRPRGPSHEGPPILIGSRGPRMLQLVAQYADIWNTAWHVDPVVVKQQYEQLQQACNAVGRPATSIEFTVGTNVNLHLQEGSSSKKAISGSMEEIAYRLQSFADIGATHIIVVLDPFTLTSIEQFGRVIEMLH